MSFFNRTLLCLLFSTSLARAQFKDMWSRMVNPDVTVKIVHPPSLGLKLNRVALIGPQDANTQDLISACIMDLSSSGQMEVLDRANFASILQEQELGASGYLKPDTISSLGKLLGAAVFITVRVNRYKPTELHLTNHRSYKNKQGYTETDYSYISKTQIEFNASIQATDLTTGKIYTTQRIAFSPALENVSERGYPEFPPESQVREIAVGRARMQLHQMLLSWTEERKLIFFDDKDFGMKEAYLRLKSQDYKGALEKSKLALDACIADPSAKPKYRGRVNYNMGMCHFILNNHDDAKPFLQAARDADPQSNIFGQSLGECEKALALREEMQRVDNRSDEMRRSQEKQDSRQEATADGVRRAQATKEADQVPAATASKASKTTTPGTPEARLEKLQKLFKQRVISKAEYDKKRTEILNEL